MNAADQVLDFRLGPVGNGEMSDTRIDQGKGNGIGRTTRTGEIGAVARRINTRILEPFDKTDAIQHIADKTAIRLAPHGVHRTDQAGRRTDFIEQRHNGCFMRHGHHKAAEAFHAFQTCNQCAEISRGDMHGHHQSVYAPFSSHLIDHLRCFHMGNRISKNTPNPRPARYFTHDTCSYMPR